MRDGEGDSVRDGVSDSMKVKWVRSQWRDYVHVTRR